MNIGVNYRAFYKGKMYYVAAFDLWGDEEQGTCDLMEMSPYTDAEELFGVYLYEVELMQCTGLKDKNGKEIYEGDIVRGFANDYTPIYQNGIYMAYNVDKINDPHISTQFNVVWRNGCEVIGNIYEKIDLLEVAEDGI